MSHISTLMAADVTPRSNEIETGSCNMLVKGNLPDGSPFSPFFTAIRPLIISSVTPSSFYSSEPHSPAILRSCIICPTWSTWLNTSNNLSKPSIFYMDGAKWRKAGGIERDTEKVWRLKRCPDCVITFQMSTCCPDGIHSRSPVRKLITGFMDPYVG